VSQEEWYTSAQARELLGLKERAVADLGAKGLLRTNEVATKGRRYAKDWVDDLVALLALYPPARNRDTALFELYALHRQYLAVPTDITRGRRDAQRAVLKSARDELVASGGVWPLERLAAELNLSPRRLRWWKRSGELAAVQFGPACFVTARYARYVVEVYTRWLTVDEAADAAGVTASGVKGWIAKDWIPVVMLQGMNRIDPRQLAAFLEARSAPASEEPTFSFEEAAREIGCTARALASRVSAGGVMASGWRDTRRLSKDEVARWKEWFNKLNAEFSWLQPVVERPGRKVRTITARQTARILGIGSGTTSLWSQADLLPFFPGSFLVRGPVTRLYVRQYVMGLRRFASGPKVRKREAVAYKKLCQEKGNIV